MEHKTLLFEFYDVCEEQESQREQWDVGVCKEFRDNNDVCSYLCEMSAETIIDQIDEKTDL